MAFEATKERQINGKCRIQPWCLVLTGFLLWFLLLFFYRSGSVISLNDLQNTNFVDSNSTDVPLNSDETSGLLPINRDISVLSKTGDLADPDKDVNVADSPIENFFIGGDWDTVLDDLKDPKLAEFEAQSDKKTLDLKEEEKLGNIVPEKPNETNGARLELASDSCRGRYIYVHDIPSRFNVDLLKNCKSLREWTDMCPLMVNSGLGPHIPGTAGWFSTDQFMLDVIFHNRMKQYKCLTNDSSMASATFVPYYAGLDVARYLWNFNASTIDSNALDLVKWLREKPEWKKMWGRDHFFVAGRITWDFRRLSDQNSQWGSELLLMPESKNMTVLVIESSPWHSNDFAIPYPTYFHPSSDMEVFQWQNKMRRQKRRFLFSFAGGSRPNLQNSIRGDIINQCRASQRKCKLLECVSGSNQCYKPLNVMKMFQNSIFCLQPQGDSYTRRSAFDSILAGCIPVFFHPGSAYVQYIWHLPKDYTKYSVFISEDKVKEKKISIERVLSRIPKRKMLAMREEVIRLIPRVVYANPKSRLETLEDAFDVTINGVVERIETTRKEVREGKNFTSEHKEELSWKYNLLGRYEEHEWDPFFARI
ncbi:probable xyloglucan galactosyltransferase GT11 [Tripterygium wilfordii]|uniref:probable xyloglucan galactosyltransferase GT11 n=1 Tax=Tripterygium wilfordii TaxID=458696 RepID=UPI0018F7FD6B|nr:probable xyloglucan galactosyltransferase GT11 [Tripterygium wilfordii]